MEMEFGKPLTDRSHREWTDFLDEAGLKPDDTADFRKYWSMKEKINQIKHEDEELTNLNEKYISPLEGRK